MYNLVLDDVTLNYRDDFKEILSLYDYLSERLPKSEFKIVDDEKIFGDNVLLIHGGNDKIPPYRVFQKNGNVMEDITSVNVFQSLDVCKKYINDLNEKKLKNGDRNKSAYVVFNAANRISRIYISESLELYTLKRFVVYVKSEKLFNLVPIANFGNNDELRKFIEVLYDMRKEKGEPINWYVVDVYDVSKMTIYDVLSLHIDSKPRLEDLYIYPGVL